METSDGDEAADRLPLEEVRVLEVAHNLAGPYAAQILADLGAAVTKVERPGVGDPARAWGPPFCRGEGAIFAAANRNKRMVELDLADPADAETFRALLAGSDVLIEALRPGAMERLGVSWEAARELNPRLLYCSVFAYGEEGPLRSLPGFDPLMQAHGGIMAVTGPRGGPRVRAGTSVVDMATGMWLAVGILAALRERDRTGRGRRVSAALFDTALAWSAYHIQGFVSDGYAPGPMGTELPMIAPYAAFPTAGGELMIAAGNDELFARLAAALELDDLPADPRFATNPERVRNRDALFSLLAEVTQGLATDALLERLREAGVPAAPILGIPEVVADPQTRASEMLTEVEDEEGLLHPSVALPLRFDGRRVPVRSPPPPRGK